MVVTMIGDKLCIGILVYNLY